MTGAIMMCTSNHVRPQQYRFLLVFLVFLLQIQGADAVGSASAAAQAATQGVAGLALGAVGARAATITTTGDTVLNVNLMSYLFDDLLLALALLLLALS
jgi:hypothetical protein